MHEFCKIQQIQINKFLQSTNIAKSRWVRTTTRARGQPGTCTPWSSVLLAAIHLSLRWFCVCHFLLVFIFAWVFVLCITNSHQFRPYRFIHESKWLNPQQSCYRAKSGVSKKRTFNEHHSAPVDLSVGWVWLKRAEFAKYALCCLLPFRS